MKNRTFVFILLSLIIFSFCLNSYAEEKTESSEVSEPIENTKEPIAEQNPPPAFLTTTTSGAQPYKSTENFQVEPQSGTATLNIPIDVPPGRKGIQPTISLMYNSSSPNGILGVGWNLELGSIQRSTKRGVPKYNSSDTFVLVQQGSSQELVFDPNAGFYRAKIEGAFMKIENNDSAGWLVTDKKGIKYYFGQNQSSQQYDPNNTSHIFKWCLDKVQDLNGNYMTIEYSKDSTNQIYPYRIYYIGNPAFPNIEFVYENRTDANLSYRTSFTVTTAKKLSQILVKIDNNLQRRYQINYSYSPSTNRSILDSIRQYGADNQTSLPPTSLIYTENSYSFNPSATWISGFQGDIGDYILGDFNGDGITDISAIFDTEWKVALSNGTGFNVPQNWLTQQWGDTLYNTVYTGDFNGDGLTDACFPFFRPLGEHTNIGLKIALSTGSNFGNFSQWLSRITNYGDNFSIRDYRFGDFNGDGFNDVIESYTPRSSSQQTNVYLSTGNGFESAGDWYPNFGTAYDIFALAGDFNGDGITDISKFDHGTWQVAISTGHSFLPLTTWVTNYGADDSPFVIDANNDGLSDAMAFNQSSGRWQVAYSDGVQFNAPVDWINNFGSEARPMPGDFNGDGIVEPASQSSGELRVASSNGFPSDLLSQIKNGIGATTQITYTPSTQYDNTGGDGISDLPFPVQTVSSVTATDQVSGQSYTSNYSYRDGYFDFEDREFRGFGFVKVIDVDGNYSETEFLQDDIYKGRIKEQRSYAFGNANPYTKVVNTWSSQDLGNGSNFVYLSKTDNFIFDGNATGKRTQSQYFYEESPQYGNLTKSIELGEVALSSGDDLDPTDNRYSTIEYTYNTSLWLLSLPKRTYLQDYQNNTKSEKRFYYDNNPSYHDMPLKGNLTKQEDWLFNPITSNSEFIPANFTYDEYGNLSSTTDALNHQTTIQYDSTYHLFPLTTTNTLGHTVVNEYYGVNGVALDDGNYKGLWGQVKSTTDPNANTSYSIYDTFGRVVKTISPYDTIEYPASSIEYYLNSTPIKIISQQREKSGQDGTLDSVSFYDGLGRLIQTKTESEQTNKFVVSGQTEYNSRGLAFKKYLPFFDSNYSFTELVPLSLNPYNPAVISYDPMGRVVQSTNPDGTHSNIIYDDWVTTTIDENGHKQVSYFDAYGRLIQKQEFTGNSSANYALYSTTNYSYDILGNLTQTRDNSDNTTNITYDSFGRKIAMTDPDMGNWSYAYDILGNLISQTDAKNQIINFEYDALNRLTTKRYPQTSNNVTYIYDDAAIANSKGRLTKAAYSQSQDTKFFYDALGREIKSEKIIDNTTYVVERSYDLAGRLTALIYPDEDVVNYTYNNAGQIEQVRSLSNSDFSTKLLLHSNGGGGSTAFLDSSALNHTITANGNAQIDNAQYQFGLASGLFDGAGDYLTVSDSDDFNFGSGDFTIDFQVRFSSVSTDQTFIGHTDNFTVAGQSFYLQYNSNNTLRFFWYYSNSTGYYNMEFPWTPFPDIWYHVAMVRTGNNFKAFVNGRQIGSTQTASEAIQDSNDLLYIGAFNNAGTPINFLNGWLDEIRISKGIARWTENFTPPTEEYSVSSGVQYYVSNVDYSASGQITHIEYGNGVVTNYTYDPNTLRLTHLVTEHQASRIQALTYTYDNAGNILQITDNLDISRNQTFTYDEINRLKTANGVYGNKDYAYNEIGNIISKDGLTYSYIPGDVGSGPHAVTSLSDGTIFNYDVNGNMIRTTNSESRTTTYEYDFENRLKQVYKDNKLLAQFQYDGDGGRTKKTIYPTSCGGNASLNQPLENRRYVFEFRSSFLDNANLREYISDNSRLISDYSRQKDYSSSNLKLIQLITQNTLPLSPGINELALAFKEIFIIKEAEARPPPIDIGPGEGGGGGPAITLYVGSLFEKEFSGQTLLENRKHIFLGSQRICTVTNNSIKYFHTNHLGSTDTITDNNGQPIVHYEYSPYGEIALTEGGDSTDFKFTGKPLDDETGLYYYGARYYNPALGRFITPDTIVQNPFDPQSLNRYTYCRNNPVNLVDPTGNSWWSKFWGKVWNAIKAPLIAAVTAAAIVFTWGMIAPGITGMAALFSKAGFTIVASAAASTATLQTHEGQRFIRFMSNAVFDNVFGMSPRVASFFGTMAAYMTVNAGFQFGFARLAGADKAITGTDKIDTTSEAAEGAAISQEGNGINYGTRPIIREVSSEKSVLSGFDKLLKSGDQTVGVAAEALKIGGQSQHLGVVMNGLKTQSDMASFFANPLKAVSQGYLTFGISHQAVNISLLNAGYHTTINSLLSGGWSTIPSTFVYGPYGGGLTGAITYKQIKDK